MICRKATFTVSVSAVTLSNAILRLPEHKNPDFVLEKPENKGFRPQKRTKTSILCSKGLKTRVLKGKSAQKPRFCARNARKRGSRRAKAHKNAIFVLGDGCREPSSAHWSSALPATSPAGCIWQQCARQQIAATCRQDLPAAHTTVHAAVALPPRNYRKKLPPCAAPGQPTCRGILPRDGSRAQRAGDSDVGANDKGAGDDPGDGVDAH